MLHSVNCKFVTFYVIITETKKIIEKGDWQSLNKHLIDDIDTQQKKSNCHQYVINK